jgi:hypothetical protein
LIDPDQDPDEGINIEGKYREYDELQELLAHSDQCHEQGQHHYRTEGQQALVLADF